MPNQWMAGNPLRVEEARDGLPVAQRTHIEKGHGITTT